MHFSFDEIHRNEHYFTQIKRRITIKNYLEIMIKKLQFENISSKMQLLKKHVEDCLQAMSFDIELFIRKK